MVLKHHTELWSEEISWWGTARHFELALSKSCNNYVGISKYTVIVLCNNHVTFEVFEFIFSYNREGLGLHLLKSVAFCIL